MTVPVLHLNSTDVIAKAHQFYPAQIKVPHHQLRNFISTVYHDRIYYVNNFDVYLLDLQSNQRSLLATVPFEARCLTAAHGWVCVGGEQKGDCAFIRIGEEEEEPGNFCHDLIVDMLGKEIVNSMTIHRLKNSQPSKRDEVVVLISNNDKTVTIYSLSQQEALAILEHPVPMNYAAISPDSMIMAAVGDSNEVFFYERADVIASSNPDDEYSEYPEYDWKLLAVSPIPMGEYVYDDFSFSVAFSASGTLCAVSSQGGAITVFDMQSLKETPDIAEEAIICSFRSSRSSVFGCVRSMAFSPEPWELLAWTEDHGRAGLADVRQGFVRRQLLDLNKDQVQEADVQDITPVELQDLGVKERLRQQHLQRMRASRGHPPADSRMAVDSVQSTTNQNSRSYNERASLDARERAVLEALETTLEEVDGRTTEPFSINYTSSSPTVNPSASLLEAQREYDVQLLNPASRYAGIREPRRRTSVVLSDPNTNGPHLSVSDNARTTMTASPGPISEDDPMPTMSTNDLTPATGAPSSQPLPYHIPPSDPWHVIEASLATHRRGQTAVAQTSPGMSRIESAMLAERQMSERLEAQLAEERRRATALRTELEQEQRRSEARYQDATRRFVSSIRLPTPSESSPSNITTTSGEQPNARRRTEDTQSSTPETSQRLDQVILERDILLGRLRLAQAEATIASSQSLALSQAATEVGPSEDNNRQQLIELQAVRRQRIHDLESQLRRAQSRVDTALLQSALHTDLREVSQARINTPFLPTGLRPTPSGGMNRAAVRASNGQNTVSTSSTSANAAESPTTPTSPIIRRMRHRTQNEIGFIASPSDRSTIPRTSELSGRVTDNDLRLARAMYRNANTDNNGNWTPLGIHRLLLGRQSTSNRPTENAASAIEELIRDGGVGTAGIGWSPNGESLYIGSEKGIFEFKLNVQDRMQFPILEMR